MISYIDLQTHLHEGEDNLKEFKPSFKTHREDIGQTICAFSNDYNWIGGGYIYIGLNNNGVPIGLSETYDEIQKGIADICRQSISPCITSFAKTLTINGKEFVEVKILRSINRPTRYRQVCYIRTNSTTRKATNSEENIIKQNSLIPSFDSQPAAKFNENDIDWTKFKEYLTTTKTPDIFETTTDLKEIANNLELTIKSENRYIPKIGTLLLFGIQPSKLFPNSKVQTLKYNGLDITSPISARRTIEGTLPDLMKGTRDFIENLASKGGIVESDSITRVELIEYPFIVLREAIANAVTHRDYSIDGREIDVHVFDDRIEIISPGGLGGGLKIEDLGTGKRYVRNYLIADLLNEMRYIERAGTGIARIYKEMNLNGSPKPKFESDSNTFKAIIPAHPFYSSKRLMEEAIQEKLRANFELAAKLFSKALEINPKNYSALTNWADLESQTGNRENARALLRKATDIDPANPTAWLALAFLEEKLGNTKTARDIYSSAAKIVSNPSVILRSWGILEWNKDDYKKADDLFDMALKVNSKDFVTLYKRGQMNINSANFTFKRKGEEYLRKALTLTTDGYILSDIYFLLARGMEKLNYSFHEIDDFYKKSLDLNPGRGTVLYNYGEFLERNRQTSQGKVFKDKALKIGYLPKNKKYYQKRNK
jgi:ATP-dependent DNA helicase RecG